MLSFGPLAFAQPWVLLALIGLPIIWWLLRLTPPAPKRQAFPAIRLLLGLKPPEETPAKAPLWLLLLRVAAIAALIAGLAQPLVNPRASLEGDGPLLIVLDDGWAAARNWPDRMEQLDALLDQAERESRQVIVAVTASRSDGELPTPQGPMAASEARNLAQSLEPKPWQTDRLALVAQIEALPIANNVYTVWLADGLDDAGVEPLANSLLKIGSLDVVQDPAPRQPRLLLPPLNEGTGLVLKVRRLDAEAEDLAVLAARADDGSLVARQSARFDVGETEIEARFDLPAELRNRIGQIRIQGENSVGAAILLDERWRRRPVGLVTFGTGASAQPLLSEIYYLERGLEPYTELRKGSLDDLLSREVAVLVLTDQGPLPESQQERLERWIERGGLLLRFAGPRLAERSDELLPVTLRRGGRILGGALTWDRPAALADFDPDGPFAGLTVPEEVVIRRQVLAEPSLDLGEKTWASLADGTPLVTAEARGKGQLVFFHTTANTSWSDLPLSGLFVDLLRRVVAVSQGVDIDAQPGEVLAPLLLLDGYGRLGAAWAQAQGADAEDLDEGRVGPLHPPGYYGNEGFRRAHNLAATTLQFRAMDDLPAGATSSTYASSTERDLRPWLLGLALCLLLIDFFIAIAFRGLLRPAAVTSIMAAVLLVPGADAIAQARSSDADAFALNATLETRLGYVRTGVPALDDISRAGLSGLTKILNRRTSVAAAEPLGVDLIEDELAFFPLLYWPITPEQRSPSEVARRKLNDYMRNGGSILIDLREPNRNTLLGQSSRNGEALARLTNGLDIPPLAPVPPDHVLTKSFYLMQDFPGRYTGGPLWIDADERRSGDGVATVLIGSNDWGSAWAIGELGRPLFAVVPGGERQREMAYRFGVNLVMYALTGNYKADQVHVPAILERLGQ